jgi:multidrug efflux pump subunit AcrA (membrane-fusion protein)
MVMKRLIRIIVLGVAASGLSACGRGEDPLPTKAAELIPVTVAAVAAIDTAERLEAGGVVAARESASISSRITATIAGIRVNAGDRVRAGDVLLTLDGRDVTAHTAQARASAVAAEKALTQARIKNATRPKPVSQSRRRGSRAVERASKAPTRIWPRRGPRSVSRRRPNPLRPCGHRSMVW